MRRFVVVIVTIFLITLIGCKPDKASRQSSAIASKPSNTAVPDASAHTVDTSSVRPANAEDSDRRPVIVCFGDSLTAGYGTEAGQTYPDYLQADLDAAGYKYHVVNAGISGNTTKDGVERLSTIIAMKAAIVVVEFGGNDGLRGLRIEDTRANLDEIVATLKSSGTQVVLAGITLPPDYGQDYIRQFNETYVLLAKKFHVPLLPFLLQGVFGIDGMMQRDRTHATPEGNKIIAKNILTLIEPLLKN